MKIKLGILMFTEYLVLGAYVPVLTLYLKEDVGLNGNEIGIILSLSSVVALFSPIVGAAIADRIISSERLFSLCHLAGGFLMLAILRENSFEPIALYFFLYSMFVGPTIALSNSITFQHCSVRNRFGNIRLWGTLGWIGAALIIWIINNLWEDFFSGNSFPLRLSAYSSFVLSAFVFVIPVVKLNREKKTFSIIPADAFSVFKDRKIVMITLISLFIIVVDKYYYFGMAPFLQHLGLETSQIFPIMSVGQGTEVIVMFYLSLILKKIGFKRILVFGVIAEILRFSLFVFSGGSFPLIVMGIAFHGLAYAFFFTSVFVYMDSHCRPDFRAGVHQLFSFVTSGLGTLIANMAAGYSMDLFVTGQVSPEYSFYWFIPLFLSFFALFLFLSASGKDRYDYDLVD